MRKFKYWVLGSGICLVALSLICVPNGLGTNMKRNTSAFHYLADGGAFMTPAVGVMLVIGILLIVISLRMSFPSRRKLNQISSFLYMAITIARVLAWENKSHEQIADLLDAVHNLPDFINKWDEWNENYFLEMLKAYDDKWVKDDRDFSLLRYWQSKK